MTTRQTQREDMLQIKATADDIKELKRREIMYPIGTYENRIAQCLININQTVLSWQMDRAGIDAIVG